LIKVAQALCLVVRRVAWILWKNYFNYLDQAINCYSAEMLLAEWFYHFIANVLKM
jgi:hypothetical protein